MNRIPSLDLLNGKVVRLQKGDFKEVTVYSQDPCACVEALKEAGATCVHIVDLDQTQKFSDLPIDDATINTQIIKRILLNYGGRITLQLGGGIRSYEVAQFWFDQGIDRLIIGTLFFSDYACYKELVNAYPGKIILALDVKNDAVCHTGWQVDSKVSIDAILKSGKIGDIHSILVTDINTDGMLSGPNINLLERLKQSETYPIIASGGISCEADCKALEALKMPYAIIGKAYYEGYIRKLGET